MRSAFLELRRRKVFRVAAGYGVVAWLLIQVADTTFPAFGAPDWALRVVIGLAVLGFPLAVVLAWAFDLTPEGIQRTSAPNAAQHQAPSGARRPLSSRAAAWVGVGIVLGLTTVGAYGWLQQPVASADPAEAATVRSIAVLPFTNLSADPGSDYFSEGISEEILNALSQVPQLRVAARTSAFTFSGGAASLDSIGRALGVESVLEGSVRTVGDRVRITARLVEAATGHPLWSKSYDRETSDILAVQEEIAVAIANALQVRLAGKTTPLTRSRTADPVAYELYLQGRHLANSRTPEGLTESVGRFEAALQRDPAFAAAYSGLADAYALLEDYAGMPREEAFPKSIAAAHRALELDEMQAEAHTSLGHVYYEQKNWVDAEAAYQRALELNPSYALAHHWYGNLLGATRRYDEAARAYDRALALDPLSAAIPQSRLGPLYNTRQFEEVIEASQQILRTDPAQWRPHYFIAWSQMALGNHAEAAASTHKMIDALGEHPPARWTRAQLAAAYAAGSRDDEAARLLHELENEMASNPGDTPYWIALAYGYAGDHDRAFYWLERAPAEFWMGGVIASYPAFDRLRSDPRFTAIVERLERLRTGSAP